MSSISLPKISVVTPNYNQSQYLEKTILSVLNQNYSNLEYIIIDGGSTDNSLEVIKKYENQLTYWISEPDNGMYFALQKGLEKCDGEIMGWINSDDMLHPGALERVASLFKKNPTVRWIQGYPTVIDEKGNLIHTREHRYIQDAFLLKRYHDWKFIQQESTYWRRSLWIEAGSRVSTEYRFAGDFELWMRFFKYSKLYVTNEYIGAFRCREGQLSEINGNNYILECDHIINHHIKSLCIFKQVQIKVLKSLEPFLSHRLRFTYDRIRTYCEIDSTLYC